jgi:hypothetical protein
LFHSSLSNLYNNVIIYNISRENSFICERNVQNVPIRDIRALYIVLSLYLALTIEASSRLKRSANHIWLHFFNSTVAYTYNHCAGTVDYRTKGILG